MKVEYDQKAWKRLKRQYSFGVVDENRHIISARRENGRPHCMKCGGLLTNRSAFKLVNGEWVEKKFKRPLESAWVCEVCTPIGVQPLAVGISPKVVG